MLSGEELDYLTWLTEREWSGVGDVVEFGPWLGASTAALAAGMRRNPGRRHDARLHAVDTFAWHPFMERLGRLGLAPGATFRPHFEANLEDFADLVVVHERQLEDDEGGDIQARLWDPLPPSGLPVFAAEGIAEQIGIVFVDGAKSWRALHDVLATFAPRMEPGGVIAFQDFKDWASYWVPMLASALMAAAPGALEVAHVLPTNTVTLRVRESIPASALAAVPARFADASPADARELNETAARLLSEHDDPQGAAIVRLGFAAYLGAREDWTEARRAYRACERRWPIGDPRPALERARPPIEALSGRRLPPALRTRAARIYHRAARSPRARWLLRRGR